LKKPDYGIDAPGVIRNLLVCGALALAGSFFLRGTLRVTAGITAAVFLFEGAAMYVYAKHGKFRHRDRMLAMLAWKGGEQVLDVGTGRGLMMIGAAKKLAGGRAFGIDIWNAEDLTANSMSSTLRNIALEGVKDRAELSTGDARELKFADGTLDVVVSNLALHNIPDAAGRAKACAEIARVLKPGGTALVSDFRSTGEYSAAFKKAGLAVSSSGPYLLDTFPPLRIIRAVKPGIKGQMTAVKG